MKTFTKLALVSLLLASPAWAYNISITKPSEERAYQRPMQTIEVQVSVSPRLEADYQVVIILDGVAVGDGLSADVPTVEVFAGEHLLEAVVMDKDKNVVAKDSRKVYVIQNNRLVKKKNAAIEAWEEYDNSSIWRKLAIGLNPKVQAPPKVTLDTPTWELMDKNWGLETNPK